jgi:multidrug efflux pump subunit AcrA (membrane-fusion protein)
MRRQIYRKEALERMGSPEQLDQLMAVTSPRGWIALAGIGLLLLIALLWSVFGSVATTVDGQGVLVRRRGVAPVVAPADGEVSVILVQVGDMVRKGAELARLIPRAAAGSEDRLRINSPADGRVLDVAVLEGHAIARQETLLTIESSRYPLEAVVYLSAAQGYSVERGQDVRIMPAAAEQRTASHLRGRVRVAGKIPATQASVMRNVPNGEWAARMLGAGPMLEVIAEPDDDGWPPHLYSGTPCQARITVDRQRPIQLVLPVATGRRGD